MQPIVVSYRDEFRDTFERLNRAWIETYFVLEDADREVFADPRAKIVDSGGEIFFVLEGEQVLGTCAVMRHSADECEIAKMAVAPGAQGRGFGDLLMNRAMEFAAELGARRVIILSNTVLEPAIRLYRKHGFVQVPLETDSRYERANIRLDRELRPTEPALHRGADG